MQGLRLVISVSAAIVGCLIIGAWILSAFSGLSLSHLHADLKEKRRFAPFSEHSSYIQWTVMIQRGALVVRRFNWELPMYMELPDRIGFSVARDKRELAAQFFPDDGNFWIPSFVHSRKPVPVGKIELISISFPLWMMLITFWAVAVLSIMRWWKTKNRVTRGCCFACGYDLRGGHDVCPECGRQTLRIENVHRNCQLKAAIRAREKAKAPEQE